MSKELKINWKGGKESFVEMRELMKRCFFFHKTQKQCENKSLVLNVIRYGFGLTRLGLTVTEITIKKVQKQDLKSLKNVK